MHGKKILNSRSWLIWLRKIWIFVWAELSSWETEHSMEHRMVKSTEGFNSKKKSTPVYQEILSEARKSRGGIFYGLALLPCQRLNLTTLSKLMFWDRLAVIAHLVNQIPLMLPACSWSIDDTLSISQLPITEKSSSLRSMEPAIFGCSWPSGNAKTMPFPHILFRFIICPHTHVIPTGSSLEPVCRAWSLRVLSNITVGSHCFLPITLTVV